MGPIRAWQRPPGSRTASPPQAQPLAPAVAQLCHSQIPFLYGFQSPCPSAAPGVLRHLLPTLRFARCPRGTATRSPQGTGRALPGSKLGELGTAFRGALGPQVHRTVTLTTQEMSAHRHSQSKGT